MRGELFICAYERKYGLRFQTYVDGLQRKMSHRTQNRVTPPASMENVFEKRLCGGNVIDPQNDC